VEGLPDPILFLNERSCILLVNARAEELFGYTWQQLLGMCLEDLLSERYRGAHVRNRSGYFSQPLMRSMGSGLDLYTRRKDGSEFAGDVNLPPCNQRMGCWS
jgi:PAS domain S-box-containing protein